MRRGMLATAFGVVKEEGPFKLWYGMSSIIYRHTIYRLLCHFNNAPHVI